MGPLLAAVIACVILAGSIVNIWDCWTILGLRWLLEREMVAAEEEPVTPPDGLEVGEKCYAVGTVVAKQWFQISVNSTQHSLA